MMLFPAEWPPDSPVGHPWFTIGVNYPYLRYSGRDMGPNQFIPEPTTFNSTQLSELQGDFSRMKRWGIDVVRMYVFERGEGLEWERAGEHWIVSGINTQFCDNVAAITAAARDAGIRIYWCLLQSADFEPNRYRGQSEQLQTMNRAFRYMLDRNNRALRRFLDNALSPFIVEALLPNIGGVFAIDVMNEPDMLWCLAPEGIQESLGRTSSLAQRTFRRVLNNLPGLVRLSNEYFSTLSSPLMELISYIAQYIKTRYEILVSSGFMYFNTIRQFHGLFDNWFDFYDFHFYDLLHVRNPMPNLPSWSERRVRHITKPCIIGECGLGGQIVNERLRWPFLGNIVGGIGQFPLTTTLEDLFNAQANFIEYCFTTARQNEFAGCFIWEYGKQFRRVTELARSLTDGGNCPRNRRENWEIGGCLMWMDRIPLLWKQGDGRSDCSDMCIRRSSSELCGRPVVRRIEEFTNDLEHLRLRPNWQSTGAPQTGLP